MRFLHFISFGLLSLFLLVSACKKEHNNPFDRDDDDAPVDTSTFELEYGSFAWIHHHVLGQLCANSGCHDGNFEPDFRTIYSAYNTIVYQPVIKNSPQGNYTYRVLPGNPSQSLFLSRMKYDIDGVSGIMPLVVEPGTDWLQRKEEYLDAISKWIQDGAKDHMGNIPEPGDVPPQVVGVAAQNNSQWLQRADGGIGHIQIPQSATNVRFYFAVQDDNTAPQEIGHNQIRFSTHPNDFSQSSQYALQILGTPVTHTGFPSGEADYYHYIDFSPQSLAAPGQTIFFRIYVTDNSNPVAEIPSTGAANYVINYFSFRRSN